MSSYNRVGLKAHRADERQAQTKLELTWPEMRNKDPTAVDLHFAASDTLCLDVMMSKYVKNNCKCRLI